MAVTFLWTTGCLQHWLSSGSEIPSAQTLFSQDFENHKLTTIFTHHQKKDLLFLLKKITNYHLLVCFCNSDSGCIVVWFWVSLNSHFLFGKINPKSNRCWGKKKKHFSFHFMLYFWLRTYSNWECAFYSLGLCQVK